MTYIEVKRPLATLEFELVYYRDEIILNICAYGDWWEEAFKSEEDLNEYLKSKYKLDDENIRKLKEHAERINR